MAVDQGPFTNVVHCDSVASLELLEVCFLFRASGLDSRGKSGRPVIIRTETSSAKLTRNVAEKKYS